MRLNHTLTVAVISVALALVHSSSSMRTRASSVVAAPQEIHEQRGILSRSVSAQASGRGNPWVTLRDGSSVPVEYHGASSLVQQLRENATRPLSLGSADFDEDGVPDLVAGYAGTQTGWISVQRGDADTIFPNTAQAIARSEQLRPAVEVEAAGAVQSPFFVAGRTFDVSSAPQILGTGDFDGDGHRDVLTAEKGRASLVLLSGDGRGEFAPARSVSLPGKVTSMATGDANRIDGLDDVLVAVKENGTPRLLIYEGPEGALKATPETIALPAESGSIAVGQLDESFPVDIAAAAGRELIIIRGRDRKRTTADGKKLNAEPPVVTRLTLTFSISSVAIGDFAGDPRHEIALLSDDGTCHVFSRTGTSISSWQQANAVALPIRKSASAGVIVPARVSSSPKDDLLILDQAGRQLHILINESAVLADDVHGPSSSSLRVAGTIDFEGEPLALVGMRLNSDALNDLVVLESTANAPTVIMTAPATIFTVTNTNDSNAGSLRQAILDANSNSGSDVISFSIPGAGTQTISPLSPLPLISEAVTLDGTSQNPGSPTPPIELAGNSAGEGASGLRCAGGNSTVRGLVINRFDGVGVELFGSGSIVEGNFIGTNAAGTAAQGNGGTGVLINSGSGNIVGGTVAAARNVISGNVIHGVQMLLGPSMNHQVQGNFIGTNAGGSVGLGNQSNGVAMLSSGPNVMNCTIGGTTPGSGNVISANVGSGVQLFDVGTANLVQGNLIGTNASGSSNLGNQSSGVTVNQAGDCTIGGTVAGAGNVISGNGSDGVRINSATGTRVQGNNIGTLADGTSPLPNSENGIYILNDAPDSIIGGALGAGNIIAFNFAAGVRVETGDGNAIQANSIFSNSGLGIDLGPLGVTPNDAGDGDGGANNLQNFPVLTSSNGVAGGGVNVQGTLNSNPNTTFTLDFFSSSSCDPSGNGEGRTFLGSASVATSGSGNATFNVTIAASASTGQSVTATATDPQGNTSEFSNCIAYGAADLAISKTASSATIVAGSNVTYTITVANNGPDAATSLTVTDNLPASLAFVSCASTGNGVCGGSGNNRTVTFGLLASGASETITIVGSLDCSVSDGQSIGNTATVTSLVPDPVSANNTASVIFSASNPPRTILPTSRSITADGGDGTISVTSPAGCGWQAVSNDSWITITSGSSGVGNGTVGYNVAFNATGIARVGTLTIAALTFTVNQSNIACSYSILPVMQSYPASGGAGNVSVTAQEGCFWKAISNDDWIVVVPGTDFGFGNGTTSYTVQANTNTASRTGSVTVAGVTLTVMQAGVPCEFSIQPGGKLFPPAGSEAVFTLTTLAGCGWTASTNENWIFISSEGSGTGPAVVSYGVRDNLSGSPRQGTITVGGLSFMIVQEGGTPDSCAYVLNPSSAVFASAGGKGNVQVLTSEQCAWEAKSSVTWITISSQVVGIGASTITYDVKSNPGPDGRAGTIVIGGRSFRIKQRGS